MNAHQAHDVLSVRETTMVDSRTGEAMADDLTVRVQALETKVEALETTVDVLSTSMHQRFDDVDAHFRRFHLRRRRT